MSERHKVINSTAPTFVTLTFVDWVDELVRPVYTEIMDEALEITLSFPFHSNEREMDVSYNYYGNPETIEENNLSVEYSYGIDQERRKMVVTDFNTSAVLMRYYFGNYERQTANGETHHVYYINAGDGLAAMYVKKDNDPGQLKYVYKDYLGSITILTDAAGSVITGTEHSFDAWGNYRNPDTWERMAGPDPAKPVWLWRGYTGHEHLFPLLGGAGVGSLIHMNGRLYDPLLGRMLSPDNNVQAPNNYQNYNRYAYVMNNPMKFTDPSGEFLTWSINNGGFSIGFNLTPIGIPLGAGINVGTKGGLSLGAYGEVAVRVLNVGSGIGQSLDYNFKSGNWSTTTSLNASVSFGIASFGGSLSSNYNLSTRSTTNGWGVYFGLGIEGFAYDDGRGGMGFSVGYGSNGLTYGISGYYYPERPKIYKSPISDNYGEQNGECALRCFEEFSDSYGMGEYDFDYWLEQNDGKLGVHAAKVESLIDNTGGFKSDRITPQSNINVISDAFTNDKRVLMGFKTSSGGEHAVMVSKVKIWSSGRYRVYFSETSPVRLAPYSTTNLYKLPGAGFWTFYH